MFRFLAACTVRLYRTDKCCECYVYAYAKQTVGTYIIYIYGSSLSKKRWVRGVATIGCGSR